MSFEKPERCLTQEEWEVLTDAAEDAAQNYRKYAKDALQDGFLKVAELWHCKARKVWDVILNLEDEYYQKHPDEDPNKEEG